MSLSPQLPTVTVVILNWNGRRWLEAFLPSVFASGYPALTVMVVDNGSTDDSVAWLKAAYPGAQVLELGHNHGFAQGNNLAIPHIHTPYAIFLNSDVEVSPGWISPLVQAMEQHPALAAVQPKLLAFHQRTHFEYAGASGGWIDRFGYAFCRGRVFDELEEDRGQHDEPVDCLWASGACLMVRMEVVRKIGLFEGELFAHWEEIDFCWRAWNLGYRVGVVPASVVYHVGGGTLPQGNPRKTFLNVRNSLLCLWMHLPARRRPGVVFARLVLDGVWAVKALAERQPATLWAILKAHFAFYGMAAAWGRKRRALFGSQGPAAMPPAGYWPQSVVWAYFIRKKKTFGELMGSK